MSRIDSPTAPQFSPPELRAMVEEATRASLIVAAHCHGKAGIIAALEAGVRTIEHGSYLDDEGEFIGISSAARSTNAFQSHQFDAQEEGHADCNKISTYIPGVLSSCSFANPSIPDRGLRC